MLIGTFMLFKKSKQLAKNYYDKDKITSANHATRYYF